MLGKESDYFCSLIMTITGCEIDSQHGNWSLFSQFLCGHCVNHTQTTTVHAHMLNMLARVQVQEWYPLDRTTTSWLLFQNWLHAPVHVYSAGPQSNVRSVHCDLLFVAVALTATSPPQDQKCFTTLDELIMSQPGFATADLLCRRYGKLCIF